jgi:hypothetical protein
VVPGLEWTAEENKKFKEEVEGKAFPILTLTDEVIPGTSAPTAGIVLLEVDKDGKIK